MRKDVTWCDIILLACESIQSRHSPFFLQYDLWSVYINAVYAYAYLCAKQIFRWVAKVQVEQTWQDFFDAGIFPLKSNLWTTFITEAWRNTRATQARLTSRDAMRMAQHAHKNASCRKLLSSPTSQDLQLQAQVSIIQQSSFIIHRSSSFIFIIIMASIKLENRLLRSGNGWSPHLRMRMKALECLGPEKRGKLVEMK